MDESTRSVQWGEKQAKNKIVTIEDSSVVEGEKGFF